MIRARNGYRRPAVSLLEITLAVGIIVPVLSMLFVFYAHSLETSDESTVKVRRVQLARVIMDRIARELRQSTGFSAGYGTGIFGTRHEVSINTVVIPDKAMVERRGVHQKRRPGQFDLRQVDYYIAWDRVNLDENGDPRALGLVRRERRTFNELEPEEIPEEMPEEMPMGDDVTGEEAGEDTPQMPGFGDRGRRSDKEKPGGVGREVEEPFDDELKDELEQEELEGAKRELYAPEIKFIELFYHDGTKWWESWEISSGNALPQMVMITIGYEPELPEDEEIEIIKDILEDEEDIEPLPEDRFMMIVRIPQADSFFGSRVQREASAFAELGEVE